MFKKIVSLTAAAVLAAGCAAVLPEDNGISADLKASAASVLDFNAGLFFQTKDYMYRDGYMNSGKAGVEAEFPSTSIGVYGGLGFDKTEGNFTDVKITGAGHYKVSMNNCAGKITDGIIQVDRKTKEETDPTGDPWGLDAEGAAFNMLGITTDLSGFEIIEDKDEGVVTVKYKGSDISFDNAKVTIGDKVYDAGTLKVKSDNTDNLTLMAINLYDRPETNLLGKYTMPGEDDTITIDFDVVYTEPAAEDKPAADKPAAVKKTSIKTAKVSAIKAKSYTGKAIKPAVTVKLGKKTLKKGTDYTVTYKNNKAVGKATVTVKGKGSYTGTITKTFKINPKKSSIKKVTSPKKKQAKVTLSKVSGATGYQIQYSTSKKFTKKTTKTVTVKSTSKLFKSLKKGKTYYFKVRTLKTVKGVKYYSDYSAAKKIKVKAK
ncbi:MAG: hypothetical protein IJ696_06090 [Ruminococcus sp.]|nr:hypothetical protein [Ruminococcus sp.]